MKSTEDEIQLAHIQAEIAAGLLLIGRQLDLLAHIGATTEDSTGRRHLWTLERRQAALCQERLATLVRMAGTARSRSVLVVEDEPLVLMLAVDCLTSAGFAVTEASSADEALEILQSNAPISTLFTDVQMAGSMNGLELASVVHGRWPGMAVVVTSGNPLYGAAGLANGDRFIAKPYRADDLAALLHAN